MEKLQFLYEISDFSFNKNALEVKLHVLLRPFWDRW
uniref:Uncharacterized protein n=1 Tax=Anguilla anguilla TaxID=7936 RepID=A0A0E9SS15_ANGAN